MSKYNLKIYQSDDGMWGWYITDYVGDEVASSDMPHVLREYARKEAYAALEDYEDAEYTNEY